MNHLEALIAQYLEWQGFFVRTNIRVGKRVKGGFEGELDIVAFYPGTPERVLHLEASLAATSRKAFEKSLEKKLDVGRRQVFTEVLPWLTDPRFRLEQFAVLPALPGGERRLGGAVLITVDELLGEIRARIGRKGKTFGSAIPERYPLLRTIQMAVFGFGKKPSDSEMLLIPDER